MILTLPLVIALTLAAASARIFMLEGKTPEIRERIASVPLRPYELLLDPPPAPAEARRRADEMLLRGWRGEGGEFTLRPPLRWTGQSRSFAFHLHAWKPLSLLLNADRVSGEPVYFKAAYEAALDWMRTFQAPALAITTEAELDAHIGRREEFPWYDMAVGLRVYRLAYMLDVIARDPAWPDDQVRLFADGLYFHMEALTREKFFKGHNNHGLYQAIGQVAAARRFQQLPRMPEYLALAHARLGGMVAKHFSASGVHLEHSPGYHLMLLQSLLGLRNAGLITDGPFLDRLERMEKALSWMIAPDFTLATFGDTDPEPVRDPLNVAEGYHDPALKYLMSHGKLGHPPEEGVIGFKDAGYAFARITPDPPADGGNREASYLAQIAAFHSRTHKHADHLSFVWYDRGRHILADPGRYAYSGKTEPGSPLHKAGFWYSDPKRMYVESTRAHNTVEIDGSDQARVGVEPFGSGLIYAGRQGELVVTECEVWPSEAVRHRRVLILKPGEFLLVADYLSDRHETPHDYAQRFLFSPAWIAEARNGPGGGVTARHPDPGSPAIAAASLVAEARPLPPVRGATEPQLLGWCSDKQRSLVPASAVGFEQKAVATARFVTLFAFAEKLEIDPAAQRVAPTLTQARFAWTADGRERRLSFVRGVDREIAVKLE